MLLIDVSPSEMFAGIEGCRTVRRALHTSTSRRPIPSRTSWPVCITSRLSRAAIAMWIDQKRPLLALNDRIEVDMPAACVGTG